VGPPEENPIFGSDHAVLSSPMPIIQGFGSGSESGSSIFLIADPGFDDPKLKKIYN
jgi:hypothetical protein